MRYCNCNARPFTGNYKVPRSAKDTDFQDKNIYFPNQTPDWSWYLDPRKDGHRRGHQGRSIFRRLVGSLARSSISGFNRVFSAENWCQRIVWTLVLVVCLFGFGFQAFHFLKLYYTKPSVVQIEVEKKSQLGFPAVTFCNNNSEEDFNAAAEWYFSATAQGKGPCDGVDGTVKRFRKTEFCNYFPKNCSGMFQNTSLTNQKIEDVVYDLLTDGNSEQIFKLGHSTEMLQDCTFNGEPEIDKEECKEMLEYSYDPEYGNCFTFPSRNLKGQLLEARESDFWEMANELSILLDVEADELMEKRKVPGVVLAIHDDSIYPDMNTDGNLLPPGSTHVISIKKSSIHLLPYPYKTNCTDIEKLPWQKNYKKNLYPKLCTVGCSQYFQLKKCNFLTKNLSLFNEVLPYDVKKVTEENRLCAKNEEKETQGYCKSICGLPCRLNQTYGWWDFYLIFHGVVFQTHVSAVFYVTILEAFYHLETNVNRTWEEKLKNLVLLKVRFATLEHKIFRHIPKYDTMELFSYLGGYSGVWLGFSLLTVYEMVEILLTTVQLAIQKYLRTTKYRRVIRDSTTRRSKKPRIKKTKYLK